MKKPSVLNRSMFNRGGTSAYGKGITSNLVSDEQRQRFNYGGRVGMYSGSYAMPPYMDQSIYQHGAVPRVPGSIAKLSESDPTRMSDWWQYQAIPEIKDVAEWEKIYGTESPHGIAPVESRSYRSQGPEQKDYLFKGVEDTDITKRTLPGELKVDEEIEEAAKAADMTVEEYTASQEDVDDPVGKSTSRATLDKLQEQMKKEEAEKLLTGDTMGAAAGIADTDMLDIEGIIDKHYDKKTALGEGLFGMAGTVLAASQEGDKAKAASILGGGLSKFGTTLAAQAKERSKLGATLEGQREIYRQSRIAEGEEDRKTARVKEEMLRNRPEKNLSLADQFKLFKTQTKDYGKSVKLTLGDKVISIPDDVDITTMKKNPDKIYKIRIGGNDIYKMYDDNGKEIEDFNIEEYITKLS